MSHFLSRRRLTADDCLIFIASTNKLLLLLVVITHVALRVIKLGVLALLCAQILLEVLVVIVQELLYGGIR